MVIEDVLSGFQIVDLENLPRDFFFGKRKDSKYVFHINELRDILDHLLHDYKLVANNGKLISTYHTQYFDSENLKHYHDHLHGKLNRIKYRIRTYEDGQSYFEIKGKRNTGFTLKSRVELGSLGNDNFKNGELLKEWDALNQKGYIQQLQIRYKRITLFANNLHEKITFDIQLQFEKEGSTWSSETLVIAESKMNQHQRSIFRDLMRALHIRNASFSKYCFGMATLVPSIKRNNFKQILRTTEKIISKYDISSSDI